MSKRADKRIYFDPPINSVVMTNDRSTEVLISDISCTGLGFRSKVQFKKGDKLLIDLQLGDNLELQHTIKATVRHEYGIKENGLYAYGVKFFRIASWYERNLIHCFVYSEKTNDS